MHDEGAAVFAAVLGFALIILAIGIAINVVICALLSSAFKRVPPPFRKLEPGLVWLLLIPCFSLIWNFFVFPRFSQSYRGYFDASGRTDVGDCGAAVGLAYCVTCVCSLVPYLGCVTGIASLILLILFLIKANDLKNMIPPGAPAPVLAAQGRSGFCPHCGAAVAPGVSFCGSCGKQI